MMTTRRQMRLKRVKPPSYLLRIRILLAGCLAMAAMSAPAQGQIEYVLQISVDGLHAEQLRTLIRSRPEQFVNFQRFVDEGATTFNARTDATSTFTLPNHASMISGRPVRQSTDDPTLHHGYVSNSTPAPHVTLHSTNEAIDYVASTFDIAHDNSLTTAMYATKVKFILFEQSYNATEATPGGRPDTFLQDGDQGINKIDRYFFSNDGGSSATMIDALRADFDVEPTNYTFVHLYEPDLVGHPSGWRSEEWNQVVAEVDTHLGQIFEMIDGDERLRDRTALILTSDHGGTLFGHGNATEPNTFTIPFFVWGPNIPAGEELYSLNEMTRTFPVRQHITATDEAQPIRNGDGGNLALSLLNLPAIDGSSINHRQDLRVEYAVDTTWHGSSNGAGVPGDGASWADKSNWNRGTQIDRIAVAGDNVFLPANDQPVTIQLGGDRVANQLTVDGDYRLTGGNLGLVTGYLHVAAERRLTMEQSITTLRSIIKTGDGTLAIDNVDGTAGVGELMVVAGRVEGNATVRGSMSAAGVVAPGVGQEIGVFTVENSYTQSGGGALEIQLGPDGVSDQLIVGGTAIYRGELRTLIADPEAVPDESGEVHRWQIAQNGWRIGKFARNTIDGRNRNWLINAPDYQVAHRDGGLFSRLDYSPDSVQLTLYQTVPGDVDGDGAFGGDDLLILFALGQYENGVPNDADWVTGDWNGDNDFTLDDLLTAFAAGAFNQPSILDQTSVSVPEPTTYALLAIGLIVVIRGTHRGDV